MTDQRFKVVFSGELMSDASLETMKDNLTRLFKSEPGKIDALFGGRPVVLGHELPEVEAKRYLTTPRQAGVNAYKEVDLAAGPSLVGTPNRSPQVAEETSAQNPSPVTYPKCGHEQPGRAECSACDTVIEKYLTHQVQLGEDAAPATAADAGTGASPYTSPSAQVGEALPEFDELDVFTTNGRIGRSCYLGWLIAIAPCFLAIIGLGFLLGEAVGVAVTTLASIVSIVIAMMISVQRPHGLGQSGWPWLLNFIPFVDGVFGTLILVLPGSIGANRYGPPSPVNSTGMKVLASLIIPLPIASIIAAIILPSYQGYLGRVNYDGGASTPADPYTTGEQAAAAAAEADEAVIAAVEAMEDNDQQQPHNPSRRTESNSPSVLEKSWILRHALITGASNGIGLALTEALARRGRALILVACQRDTLESITYELTQRFDVEVLLRACDLSEPLQPSGLLHELEQGERQIDLLINNAGIGTSGPLVDQEWAREQELIELNIPALARFCCSLGTRMVAQGGDQILDIASVAAFQPGAWMNNYYASKAYVLHFSKGLWEELRGRGVKASVLCLGPTRMAFFWEAGIRLGRFDQSKLAMTPGEIALLALHGLDKNHTLIVPGWRNRLLVLNPRLAPRWLVHRLAARIDASAVPSVPRS